MKSQKKTRVPLKLFEAFAGYGGASFALKKAGIDFECIGYSEIDKYAIECYDKNHSDIRNYGDISKINPEEIPDFDLFTGGFPCQDVSIAGKRDLNKGTSQTLLDLAVGKILIRVDKLHKKGDKFEIKTPTSIVGVRGTVFGVEVEALR